MNLFWLQYISYALLAAAVALYLAIRLNKLPIARSTSLILYSLCIVLACVGWRTAESSGQQHSPRHLTVGTVVSVIANSHQGGSIADTFQLQTGSGSPSPKFTTDVLADSTAQQPIHKGDLLGVLYRTWDNVPVTIDEIEGQHPGWHYRRSDDRGNFVFAVAVIGLCGLISALVSTRNQRPKTPEPATTLNLDD